MLRFRSRGSDSTTDTVSFNDLCYIYGGTPVCPGESSDYNWEDAVWSEAMVDVDTPNFKALQANGNLIFSPMWKENFFQTRGVTSTNWRFTRSSPSQQILSEIGGAVGNAGGEQMLTSTDTSALDSFLAQYDSERDVAITAAWANVDESEMLALASLVELPETLRFIGSVLRRLVTLLGYFRTKKLKLAAKRLLKRPRAYTDEMLNFWMELRYAVRPLAFELEQVINVLEFDGVKQHRHTARGFHSVNDVDASYVYGLPLGESLTVSCDAYVTESRSSNYRAGVLYAISLEAGDVLSVLGLNKPLASIWEVTKLSFVLDWMFNVGDLIASWEPSVHLTPLGSWCTEEHTLKRVSSHMDASYSGAWETDELLSASYGKKVVTHRIERRVISPDKPVYPQLRINLDAAKIVDLVAIARQIYRGILT